MSKSRGRNITQSWLTVFHVQVSLNTGSVVGVVADNRSLATDCGRVVRLEEFLQNMITGGNIPGGIVPCQSAGRWCTCTSVGDTYCFKKPRAACLLFGLLPCTLPMLYSVLRTCDLCE